MKNIDSKDLKIDHLVINVGQEYQINEEKIRNIEKTGLPYRPQKGKATSGFKVSNIWIGEEYFEMVHIKTTKGGGWIPEWVDRYHAGERGMVCMFLNTEDMDSLYAKLRDKKMSKPEKMKYKFLFNLITFSPPWKNAYLPYFNKVPFQIGFQQMDSEKIRQNMYKKMEPNSRNYGITGIKRIEVYGDFSQEDKAFISGLFTTEIQSNETLTWNLKDGQTISFINDSEYHVKVYVDKEDTGVKNSSKIENVEIIIGKYCLNEQFHI